jgi:hypothetical protein
MPPLLEPRLPKNTSKPSKKKTESKNASVSAPLARALPSAGATQESQVSELGRGHAYYRAQLHLARMLSEKCDLADAHRVYLETFESAKAEKHVSAMVESLIGLLRLASDALDQDAITKWDRELDRILALGPELVPATLWYCKGIVEVRLNNPMRAQRYFHRFLRITRTPSDSDNLSGEFELLSREECEARAWVALAGCCRSRGQVDRAEFIARSALKEFGEKRYRGINGGLQHLLGRISESRREFGLAEKYYKQAYSTLVEEHNWYFYLYVLYSFARLARLKQEYAQAYQYLDLMERAAKGPEFGALQSEISMERKRLETDAVDLLIDTRKGVIRTRAGESINLRKQHVLLGILEELSIAHLQAGPDGNAGLSKAEIIERVWQERYRPEAHDNKLYYNINRLRKLLEPDMKNPQYLLNWREGYRLAPGLKVQKLGHTLKKGGEL